MPGSPWLLGGCICRPVCFRILCGPSLGPLPSLGVILLPPILTALPVSSVLPFCSPSGFSAIMKQPKSFPLHSFLPPACRLQLLAHNFTLPFSFYGKSILGSRRPSWFMLCSQASSSDPPCRTFSNEPPLLGPVKFSFFSDCSSSASLGFPSGQPWLWG